MYNIMYTHIYTYTCLYIYIYIICIFKSTSCIAASWQALNTREGLEVRGDPSSGLARYVVFSARHRQPTKCELVSKA